MQTEVETYLEINQPNQSFKSYYSKCVKSSFPSRLKRKITHQFQFSNVQAGKQ